MEPSVKGSNSNHEHIVAKKLEKHINLYTSKEH